jgi:transposase
MTAPRYSEAFKQAALEKVYQRQGLTILAIAESLNMKHCTLKGWLQQAKKQGNMIALPFTKRPADWTREARLLALHQSHGLSHEALSAWCRQQGIFAHHLSQCRTDFCLDTQSKQHARDTQLKTSQPHP